MENNSIEYAWNENILLSQEYKQTKLSLNETDCSLYMCTRICRICRIIFLATIVSYIYDIIIKDLFILTYLYSIFCCHKLKTKLEQVNSKQSDRVSWFSTEMFMV